MPFVARLVPLSALAAASLLPASGALGSPVAHAAKSCRPPHYPGVGYFTSLTVSGTSCSTGSKVAVAYYRCRTKHGKAGRCTGGVLGFGCSEVRHRIPTEIYARVTCSRGGSRVVHSYQQDI